MNRDEVMGAWNRQRATRDLAEYDFVSRLATERDDYFSALVDIVTSTDKTGRPSWTALAKAKELVYGPPVRDEANQLSPPLDLNALHR